LQLIRNWLDDLEAVDLRKYDRAVLEAAALGEHVQ